MENKNMMMKVKRDKIITCMKCSICDKFLTQATTISVCLHTFCKKCIHEKLSEEDNDTCPVCDTHLGCNPLDKLRPDPNIQAIREKIFPSESRKVEAPEITPVESPEIAPVEAPEIAPVEAPEIAPVEAPEIVPVEAPVIAPVEAPEITPTKARPSKTKERLLSTLVRSTPRVTRASLRKCSALTVATPANEETPTNEGDSVDGSRSRERLKIIVRNKKRKSSGKSSKDQNHCEQMENNIERREEEEADLSKPLNTLVEAGSSSKVSRAVSEVPSDVNPENAVVRAKVQGEKRSIVSSSEPEKRKRIRRANKIKMCESRDSSGSNLILNVARPNRRDLPIWFSLVASENEEGVEPLPQVPAAFLRITDPSMPVSYLHKYLVQKLGLASEEEVQIMCYGQPVRPQLRLTSLLDLWLYTSPSHKKVRAFVGDSAKDSMMVLSYSRKVAVPAS